MLMNNHNILYFILFYLIITCSIVGYGNFFQLIIRQKNYKINLGYQGIFGLFFCSIYSYVSSFFFSHSLIHNTFFLVIGLLFFTYNFLKYYKENKRNYLILLIIFSILFISSLLFKNHDDFEYYHFPYTYFLTQFKSVLGIGVFNHGFRTPSSLFYINSLFYLPLIQFYFFHMSAILIMGFANFIIFKKILYSFKINTFNFISYLCLFSIIFINIFFYRIAEHGTDRSAQILIFVMIIEMLLIFNFKEYASKNLQKVTQVLILIALIISLKAFYILYSIFIIYLSFFLYKKNLLIKFIHNFLPVILFCFLMLLLVLLINFQNSGCFLYPVNFTCFNSLWSINIEEVDLMGRWYEQWSKGGAAPNYRVENPEIYIQDFNWVSNWVKIYFFSKVLDFLLGISFLVLVFLLFFCSKNSIKDKKNRTYKIILALLLVLFMEWFYNHPALRYGGYCLVGLLIFIPSSVFLEKHGNSKKIKNKFFILILLTILIFISRNYNRIANEHKQYSYEPINITFYNVQKNYFGIHVQIENLIKEYKECKINKSLNVCNEKKDINTGTFMNKYYFKRSE